MRLDDGEALGVLGDKLGQASHQAGPFCAGHPAPGPLVEGLAGGAYRPVHVLLAGLGRGGPHPARIGVDALEGLARAGLDPLAAHEHFVPTGLFRLGFLDQLHPFSSFHTLLGRPTIRSCPVTTSVPACCQTRSKIAPGSDLSQALPLPFLVLLSLLPSLNTWSVHIWESHVAGHRKAAPRKIDGQIGIRHLPTFGIARHAFRPMLDTGVPCFTPMKAATGERSLHLCVDCLAHGAFRRFLFNADEQHSADCAFPATTLAGVTGYRPGCTDRCLRLPRALADDVLWRHLLPAKAVVPRPDDSLL